MFDREFFFIQQLLRVLQKHHAVRALPLRVRIRKMSSDIPKPCRTQQRIAKRSEEHTSELQSQSNLVCRLLLEKKNTKNKTAGPATVARRTVLMRSTRHAARDGPSPCSRCSQSTSMSRTGMLI